MTLPENPASYPGASSEYLLQAVIERIGDELEEVVLPNKKGELVTVNVIRSYFDPKAYEDYELPAVLVRYTGTTQQKGDSDEERVASVEIVLGVYLAEYGDDQYAVSLMERIEQNLLARRILDRKYKLVLPLSWTVADVSEQPWPYWFASMSASFYMPAVSDVANEDGEPFEI
ncbi:MAG: hypothetical protein ACYC27_03115 [Armatimonadota bacterium]